MAGGFFSKKLGEAFAAQAERGKDSVGRAILASALIIGGSMGLVSLAAVIYQALGWHHALALLDPALAANESLSDRALAFLFLMFSIIAMLPLMAIVLPLLHRRPFVSFVTARSRINMPLFLRSFVVMVSLAVGSLALSVILEPDALSGRNDSLSVALFAPIAIALLPLQVLTEEVLFRGYFMQLAGRVSRGWPVRLLVPALLFAAAHAYNPEARYDFFWASANYMLLALYLGAISLRGEGIEASFGAHLGINLYATLIVGSPVSVSPSPTLLTSGQPDFRAELVSTALLLAVHYGLVFVWPALRAKRKL